MHATAALADTVTQLTPGASQSLAHLSDSELLASTRHLVGRSNQIFAALLLHLAEVQARGIHRARACSSLYTYCIYELRFSEDAAARRAGAAKLVKRFPAVLEAIASGELHLTGLLMLGPHLTLENHLEVLARAKFRTKKEIAKLVRALAPLPAVPDRIEPLGPETSPAPPNPTWHEFVSSLAPPVRELAPGQRPSDCANDTLAGQVTHAPARGTAHEPPDEQPSELPPLHEPQLYQMQFTATEELVQLVERARALLSRQSPTIGLGELHLQAMRMLVAALEKQRFAVAAPQRQRSSSATAASTQTTPAPRAEPAGDASQPAHTCQRGEKVRPVDGAEQPSPRSQPSRYIPAAERRAVFERDGARCSYVDARGQRCRETHGLELHHLKPFGKGGEHESSNLTLRCAPHNDLAAEQDFGREHMSRKRTSSRHASTARCDET